MSGLVGGTGNLYVAGGDLVYPPPLISLTDLRCPSTVVVSLGVLATGLREATPVERGSLAWAAWPSLSSASSSRPSLESSARRVGTCRSEPKHSLEMMHCSKKSARCVVYRWPSVCKDYALITSENET